MERRKTKAEGWRVSDAAGAGEPGAPGSEVRYSGELGVGVNRESSPREQSSKKKRKAVVRNESADMQEYEPCQQNDMEVDKKEGMEEEELIFVPNAVSDRLGGTNSSEPSTCAIKKTTKKVVGF